jgi:replication factor C subunit 1
LVRFFDSINEGKTTAALVVCQSEGYEVVEFNASDTRSKKSLKESVEEVVGNRSLTEYFAKRGHENETMKKQVLLMDEVDGMSGGDRGGTAELIQIIKKSKVSKKLRY